MNNQELYSKAVSAVMSLSSEIEGNKVSDIITIVTQLPGFKGKINSDTLQQEISKRQRSNPFKAKSHILSLLGNELIGSDSLAIFELVKNAYDADADNITVVFCDLNTPSQKIIIEDDGHGMSPDVIKNTWLTIGTDFKRGEKRQPSGKYNRTSLGNKGVGRLAVHKLAREIKLETKIMENNFSSQVIINWKDLIESGEFIQDLSVEVKQTKDSKFPKQQGTRIILSGLINERWTKAMLRDLVRKIESIKNPFEEISNFDIKVSANDHHQKWLEGVKTSTDILEDSLYQFNFELQRWRKDEKTPINDNDLAEFLWEYKFAPHPLMKINNVKIPSRHIRKANHELHSSHSNKLIIGNALNDLEEKDRNKFLLNKDLNLTGPIKGKFFVFNLDRNVLNLFFGGQIGAVKDYINKNYGIKIFRDSIRVYNYGEQSDDWLGLDLSKIRRAGDHFARKVTIGAIELNLSDSEHALVEKTNREGFNENIQYKKFQAITKQAFLFFEQKSLKDKERVQEFIDKFKPIKKVGFSETIAELANKIKDKNLEKELAPLIKRVEKDYNEMRDIMVNSGMTGLNLGIVFHEIDREMKYINSDLNSNDLNLIGIKGRVKNLIQILDNFSPILTQSKKKKISATLILERVKAINFNRFNHHEIIFSSPLLSGESKDFEILGVGGLLVNALSNLVDNSIYWVSAKRDISSDDFKGGIHITSDLETFGGNAIIIADNGLGFGLDAEELVTPYISNRPGGMGLGLYYTNLVMETLGGKLLFLDSAELSIPSVYDGACIVLVFPKNKTYV